MQIVFNIAENSNVEVVKGEYELVQGECCVTELKFNFPATIKGVAIDNYKKRIEFGECKELGECAKFIDDINGDIYELKEECTAFKKILVQVVLTYNNIKWKTIPVALEFKESVNAEGNTVIQAQILSFSQIVNEWENYIKTHTLRIIYNVANVPPADASSLGDTIFYLGANTSTAPLLTYGHYYRCNYVDSVYEWTDLTQDPNLADVANGIREINKNQTVQVWVGTTEEYEALEAEGEIKGAGVVHIIADSEDDYEEVRKIAEANAADIEKISNGEKRVKYAKSLIIDQVGAANLTQEIPYIEWGDDKLGLWHFIMRYMGVEHDLGTMLFKYSYPKRSSMSYFFHSIESGLPMNDEGAYGLLYEEGKLRVCKYYFDSVGITENKDWIGSDETVVLRFVKIAD